MITEKSIKIFLELAETLNFTVTANKLYMTQQAVSRCIKTLEDDLGVPLFFRSNKSITLTPEGESFLQLFKKFDTEFTECLEKIKKGFRLRKNQLRIGYQNWTWYGSAPPQAASKMYNQIPGFNLVGEMHSPGVLVRLLSEGHLDLILLYKRLAGNLDGFEYLELKEIQIMILVGKCRAENTENADFFAFSSDPLLIDIDEHESQKYSKDHEALLKYRLNPSEIIVRPNRDSVYLSVELGHGITIGSSISQVENRSIVRYPVGSNDKLICAWLKKESNPLVEAYAQSLHEAFSSE